MNSQFSSANAIVPGDDRPVVVIDPSDLDPAFGRLALLLRSPLEQLLGPDHAAIPPLFLLLEKDFESPRRIPVIVRHHPFGLEAVPVSPKYIATCVVPRAARIERIIKGVRALGVLRASEAKMFLESRHAQWLPPLAKWRCPPSGLVMQGRQCRAGWNLFRSTPHLAFSGEPPPRSPASNTRLDGRR